MRRLRFSIIALRGDLVGSGITRTSCSVRSPEIGFLVVRRRLLVVKGGKCKSTGRFFFFVFPNSPVMRVHFQCALLVHTTFCRFEASRLCTLQYPTCCASCCCCPFLRRNFIYKRPPFTGNVTIKCKDSNFMKATNISEI